MYFIIKKKIYIYKRNSVVTYTQFHRHYISHLLSLQHRFNSTTIILWDLKYKDSVILFLTRCIRIWNSVLKIWSCLNVSFTKLQHYWTKLFVSNVRLMWKSLYTIAHLNSRTIFTFTSLQFGNYEHIKFRFIRLLHLFVYYRLDFIRFWINLNVWTKC